MKRLVASLLLATAQVTPALAAPPTVTAKTAHVGSGTTLNSSSQSFVAGRIILAMGFNRLNNSADTIGVSGALSGAFTVYECSNSANGSPVTANRSFIAYAYAAGGSEVVTLTASASATALFLHVLEISGAAAASAEDAAQRACNGSGTNTPSPTVTSGTPSEADTLMMGVYGRVGNVSGFSYTEDAGNGWTQIGSVGGNTNVTYAASYANPTTSPKTHSPTTTSSGFALATMGFKSASAPPPAGGSLSLMGCCN